MLKKRTFAEGEIAIYDEAVIYKRGEYWQFRMWLNDEQKYARQSLRTRNPIAAEEKAKKLYHRILAAKEDGKKYFSLTTKQGVEQYIAYREKDVETGLIVSGRLSTIKTHLQHFLGVIGKETKLKELHRLDCEDYYYKRHKQTNGNVKPITVQNEQSTINACINWLFRNNETPISAFEFKKLPKIDSNNEAIRRATFTNDEYIKLIRSASLYANELANNADKQDEYLVRTIVRRYILIAANSGMRVGELMLLRWSDVSIERIKSNGEEKILARITVRAETSKVRKSRILYCRGGEQFEKLRAVTKGEDDDLIFSVDGKKRMSQRTHLYHFHKIVELADIKNSDTRDLVPYSLRHFMITQRIMSGLDFKAVADMCGTSVYQIEKTYYHLNDQIRYTNALADYKRNADGTIMPI
jgi:integrase